MTKPRQSQHWNERNPKKYPPPPNTERAARVVEAVYRNGFLTQRQIERLFFNGKHTNQATELLRLLFHHNVLNRRAFTVTHPVYYSIGEGAPAYLAEKLGIQGVKFSPYKYKGKPEWFTHNEGLIDVRIALTLECQKHGFTLQCLGERELCLKYSRKTAQGVVPVKKYLDEYFIITDPAGSFPPQHLPCEFDTGELALDTFGEKITACLEYMRSGAHHTRYRTASLRILTITSRGHIRVRNLKQKTETLGGKRRFWFASLDDVRSQSIVFAPIWQAASGGDEHVALIAQKANRVAANWQPHFDSPVP